MKISNLQKSLLILVGIKNQLEPSLRTLVPKERIKDEDLKFTICNHIQILICNFLEEWKILESQGKDESIRTTLQIASPAVERIRQWKGLRKVRSRLLAHGHREYNGRVAWAWNVFAKYKAPTAYAETILLGNCAIKAIKIALQRHRSIYKKAVSELLRLNRRIEERGIRTIGEIKEGLIKIDEKIKSIAREIGK